jgi:hypothetical protein
MTTEELLGRIESWGIVLAVGYGDIVEFTGDIHDPPEARLPVLKTLEYMAPDGVMTPTRLRWLKQHKQELLAAVAARSRAERATWTTPETRSVPVVFHEEPCPVKSHQHHKPGATKDAYFFPSGVCVEQWKRREVKVATPPPPEEEHQGAADGDTMPRLEEMY